MFDFTSSSPRLPERMVLWLKAQAEICITWVNAADWSLKPEHFLPWASPRLKFIEARRTWLFQCFHHVMSNFASAYLFFSAVQWLVHHDAPFPHTANSRPFSICLPKATLGISSVVWVNDLVPASPWYFDITNLPRPWLQRGSSPCPSQWPASSCFGNICKLSLSTSEGLQLRSGELLQCEKTSSVHFRLL